jgi:hypothetical protein
VPVKPRVKPNYRPVPVPVVGGVLVVPVVPVVPLVPLVSLVPVVPAAPAVPLPQAPEPVVVPVELVVGVLPVAPVVGLPRSVMAPLPLFVEPIVLLPDELSIVSVDLQAARPRPIEAARMMLSVVRFIFFSLQIGLRSLSCERPFAAAIGREREYV